VFWRKRCDRRTVSLGDCLRKKLPYGFGTETVTKITELFPRKSLSTECQ
jgi:hypothetical protein